ncbi:MAG: restriction endonuclease subunit S [Alphaproteobacteria bacterium]
MGKALTPLNDRLKHVEWGAYKYDKLFKLCIVKNKLTKLDLEIEGKTPVYSSDSSNNGIAGFTNKEAEFIISEENPLYMVFGDHTISFNIATESFCVMDNVKVLAFNSKLSINELLYIIASWKKSIPNKGYARHWSSAKSILFQLPTKNGKIDFDFMENFVAEIENERILKLENYLAEFGLNNYQLTEEENQVLENFGNGAIQLKEYKLGDLFTINTYKKRFDANKVNITDNGEPYIVRTSANNGVRGYIDEDKHFLNEGNTISFGQDTATVYYQEKPYFTGDKIKIVKAKDSFFNRRNAFYFITSIRKSFSSFSWGGSSFSVKIIKEQSIQVPVKDNKPDYETMETVISAIHKLVIKDVVLYVERKRNKP